VFLKKNSNISLLDLLCPRSDIGSLEGKRNKKKSMNANQDTSGIPHPIFNGMTQKELLDRKVLGKAFRDAEHRELQAIKELRGTNLKEAEAEDTDENQTEAEVKFQCEICLCYFHPAHVPLPKSKEGQPTSLHDIKFLCPTCLRSRRPRIELILSLLMNYNKLSLRLPEGEALTYLADRALAWQQRAEKALKSDEVVIELKKFKELELQNNGNHSKNKELEESENSESESDLDGQPKLSAVKKIPEVKLSGKTQTLLEDLLLEGELMEVSMDENQQIWKLLQAAEPRRSKKYPDLNQLEAELETAREEKLKAKKKRKMEAAANANGEAKKAKIETPEVKKRKGGRSRKKDSSGGFNRHE